MQIVLGHATYFFPASVLRAFLSTGTFGVLVFDSLSGGREDAGGGGRKEYPAADPHAAQRGHPRGVPLRDQLLQGRQPRRCVCIHNHVII